MYFEGFFKNFKRKNFKVFNIFCFNQDPDPSNKILVPDPNLVGIRNLNSVI